MSDRRSEMLTLSEVLAHLRQTWRRLAALALLGSVIGGTIVYVTAGVRVEVELGNLTWKRFDPAADVYSTVDAQEEDSRRQVPRDERPALTLTEWLQLHRGLISLGVRLDELASEGATTLEGRPWLGNAEWWAARVQAIMALSRTDLRGLASAGEGLEAEAVRVAGIGVSRTARSLDRANAEVDASVSFIRSGALWVQLQRLSEEWRAESLTRGNYSARARLSDIELELRRLRATESMLSSITSAPPAPTQTIVSVDGGTRSKFLPIRTQLNAVRVDIHRRAEEQDSLREELYGAELLARFLQDADAAAKTVTLGDGFALAARWEELLTNLPPAGMPSDVLKGLVAEAVSNNLLAEVVEQRTRFTALMPEVSRRIVQPRWADVLFVAVACGVAFVILALGLQVLKAQGWGSARPQMRQD